MRAEFWDTFVVLGIFASMTDCAGRQGWPALSSSDPGQVVHTCPAPLKLRPYGAIGISPV